jgi:hypothetical protein
MLPIFTNPLVFTGLAAAVPALVAIYLFRRRLRRVQVSSLMLWLDPKPAREGGSRIERLQTPLLFFLELAALLLLFGAAADPQIQTAQGTRPLVVVLDDSFSMRAGGEDSPQKLARAALEEELRRSPRYSVRLLAAGEHVQALGEPAQTTAQALAQLDGWRCRAPAAHLDEAISLATELGSDLAVVLVLTDHAPKEIPGAGRVQWWAFGKARPNLAFVTATRTSRDGSERVLLEIANLSADPQQPALVVETLAEGQPPAELKADKPPPVLSPGETYRVILKLPEDAPALRARLGTDALEYDNQVTLLPARFRPVRSRVRIADEKLRPLVDKALRASREALLVADRPDVVFTDDDGDDGDAWAVHLISGKDGAAYTGPFVLDRNHPLTEGLSLQGIVWGAGKSEEPPGGAVVMAGNVPLLTDRASPDGRHDLYLRLRPDLSTLQLSPAWPVLVWNLLAWRQSQAPGLDRPNVRVGEQAVLRLARAREAVEVVAPDGTARRVAAPERRLVLRAEDAGIWQVRDPDTHDVLASCAANPLSRDESDLSQCSSGKWGDWRDETALRLEYQSIAWILLLLLLGVLTIHLVLVSRGG